MSNSIKIVDYMIISDSYGYINGFAEDVKIAIKNGWQPYGGISGSGREIYQVMVKYEL